MIDCHTLTYLFRSNRISEVLNGIFKREYVLDFYLYEARPILSQIQGLVLHLQNHRMNNPGAKYLLIYGMRTGRFCKRKSYFVLIL